MKKLTQFPASDRIRNSRVYKEYEELGMVDGWIEGNKEQNFELMMKLVELSRTSLTNASCLDVGCGTGDLSAFLRKKRTEYYLGIDINDAALERAQEKYPYEQFMNADLLTQEIQEQFDFVFCSGTLTLALTDADNYDFLERMVEKMWSLSKKGIVFNVLTTDDPDPWDEALFFYDPARIYSICGNIVKDNNILIEHTPDVPQIHIYLWRDEVIS